MSKILKGNQTKLVSVFVPKLPESSTEDFTDLVRPEEGCKKKVQELSEEEVKRIKEQAIKQGFEKGYEEGKKQGFEEGKAQGFERGFEEGYAEGIKRAEEEKKQLLESLEREFHSKKETLEKDYQARVSRIENLLKKTEDELKELVLTFDKEVVDLAVEIARRLVLKEISSKGAEVSLSVIKEALNYIAEGTSLLIKVNPREYEFLKKEVLPLVKGRYKVEFSPDENIAPGGVFIESKLGVIDATFEKRWKKLLETIYQDEGKDT